jgi:hypothetical protein
LSGSQAFDRTIYAERLSRPVRLSSTLQTLRDREQVGNHICGIIDAKSGSNAGSASSFVTVGMTTGMRSNDTRNRPIQIGG